MNKLFSLILVLLVLFLGYGVFTNVSKTNAKKEKRIPCQKETITFENIANKKSIKEAIKLLESNNYIILSRIELSKYMESKILNYISKDKADEMLKNSINKIIKKVSPSDNKLLIDYYIYENDKEDKGKKSDKAKLYAGYLVFEFKLDNKLIYKIQSDYMKMDTSDISSRMDCIIKSFITIKGE